MQCKEGANTPPNFKDVQYHTAPQTVDVSPVDEEEQVNKSIEIIEKDLKDGGNIE